MIALGMPAQAMVPGYASSVAFTGVGVIRSNFVGCYHDFALDQDVCLTPSDLNLPAPRQRVVISGSYTPDRDSIPLQGDYVSVASGAGFDGGPFRFVATPTDGSDSFVFSRETVGAEVAFHNGRITRISASGIDGDDCGVDTSVGFNGATGAWPGRFSSTRCAYIQSVFPFYGVDGDWRMTAYSIDGGAFIAVPEPANWTLLIVGLGITGATLRRCRPAPAFAVGSGTIRPAARL